MASKHTISTLVSLLDTQAESLQYTNIRVCRYGNHFEEEKDRQQSLRETYELQQREDHKKSIELLPEKTAAPLVPAAVVDLPEEKIAKSSPRKERNRIHLHDDVSEAEKETYIWITRNVKSKPGNNVLR